MKLLTSRSNIVIYFLIGLACLGYLVWANYQNMLQSKQEEDNVKAAHQVLLSFQSVLSDMQDVETATHGYVISGKSSFLDPYNKALASLAGDTAAIKKIDDNIPGWHEGRQLLLNLVIQNLETSKKEIALRAGNDYDQSVMLTYAGIGKQTMDSIRNMVASLEKRQREVLEDSQQSQKKNARQTAYRFFIMTASFFCVLAVCFVLIYFNISKKEKAEAALKKMNAELEGQVMKKSGELSDIFERITDAFIALDKNFCYTYVNQRTGEMIRRDPASLLGKNVWEVFPDTVGSSTWKAFHQAMETQELVINEDYYPPLDLWQENLVYPSADGLSVFIRDISERKKAAQKIIAEKELSDSIINSLPGIFYLYDENGKFIRWNRNFETVSGYSSQEVAGMHPLDFFHKDEQEILTKRIEQVFKEGMADVEAGFYTKQQQLLPHYFNGKAIVYEGKPCLIGVGIDIGVRKKAEHDLQLSEEKYKILFHHNPMPLWMFDLGSLRFIDVNEAAVTHYGYSREKFLGMSVFDIRPAEDAQKLVEDIKTVKTGVRNAGLWRHLKQNGEIINVEIFSHDTVYGGQAVRLVLAIDVTEKLNAELLLKESYNDMRQLAAHLQDIREEERAAMAREVHDELGQLLTGIKMDISWLSKKIDLSKPEIKEKVDETTAMLDGAVKSVRKIATELRPSILDDLGLIAAMEWQCGEFEKKSGIKVNFACNSSIDSVPVNFNIGLFRILQESLTNIARHAAAKQVMVSLDMEKPAVTLKIKDDGCGFDINTIGKKKTLGLMGMKERTIMMGGVYEIDSQPGNGTTITLKVPLQQTETPV